MTADFYRRYLRIYDRTLLNELSGISKIEYFRKGEKIINAGEEQHKIFLLKDGIVRGYLINPEGRDFYRLLWIPARFACDGMHQA